MLTFSQAISCSSVSTPPVIRTASGSLLRQLCAPEPMRRLPKPKFGSRTAGDGLEWLLRRADILSSTVRASEVGSRRRWKSRRMPDVNSSNRLGIAIWRSFALSRRLIRSGLVKPLRAVISMLLVAGCRTQTGCRSYALNRWLDLATSEAEQAALVAARRPSSPSGWARSAFASLAAGQTEQARSDALHALSLGAQTESFDEVAITAGICVLAALGLRDDLERVAPDLPTSQQFPGIRASLAAHMDDVDTALALLEPLPDDSFAGLAGYLHLRRGELHQAVAMLRRAVSLQGHDVPHT